MGRKAGWRTAAALLLIAVLVAGCASTGAGGASDSASGGVVASAPAPEKQALPAGAPADGASYGGLSRDAASRSAATPVADRLVIRNADVRLEVRAVTGAVTSIRAMAKASGAVIANLQLASDTGGGGKPVPVDARTAPSSGLPFDASVTILVPAARFDAFRAQASRLGRVLSESSADEDVTQQHVDLKARLDNAKVEEARLRGMFASARSVTDMLAVERELARVQGEIESMTAQLASLDRQVAMATLTLELSEPKPVVRPENGVDWGFGGALTTGIQIMIGLLRAAVVVVIAAAPLWIMVLALLAFVAIRRRSRERSTGHGEGAE